MRGCALAHEHLHAVHKLVAGVCHDLFAILESAEDLGLQPILMPDLNRAAVGL